eukprot:1604800-Amphidinium_carterae.1
MSTIPSHTQLKLCMIDTLSFNRTVKVLQRTILGKECAVNLACIQSGDLEPSGTARDSLTFGALAIARSPVQAGLFCILLQGSFRVKWLFRCELRSPLENSVVLNII